MPAYSPLPNLEIPDSYTLDVNCRVLEALQTDPASYLEKIQETLGDISLARDMKCIGDQLFEGVDETSKLQSGTFFSGSLAALDAFHESDAPEALINVVIENTRIVGGSTLFLEINKVIRPSLTMGQASILASRGRGRHSDASTLIDRLKEYYFGQHKIAESRGLKLPARLGNLSSLGFGLVLHRIDDAWEPGKEIYLDRVVKSIVNECFPKSEDDWEEALKDI